MAGIEIKLQLIETLSRHPEGVSKRQLQKSCGISWGSVSSGMEELTDAGFVTEQKRTSGAPGRPEFVQMLNGEFPLLAGVDLGASRWRFELLNLRYEPVYRMSIPAPRINVPEDFLGCITAFIEEQSRKSGKGASIRSFGVAVSGRIDPDYGTVCSAGNLGFRNTNPCPLQSELERRFGVPAVILPAQSAALLAEHRFGHRAGVSNLILIHLGVGVSAALILDNALLVSRPERPAGHIGHLCVPGNPRRCVCGLTGCIETLAGGRAMGQEAQLRNLPFRNAEALESAAEKGDVSAAEILHEGAVAVCLGVAPLIQLYRPDAVIFSGGQCRRAGFFYREILRLLPEHLHKEEVFVPERSILDEFASALGAAWKTVPRILLRSDFQAHGAMLQ